MSILTKVNYQVIGYSAQRGLVVVLVVLMSCSLVSGQTDQESSSTPTLAELNKVHAQLVLDLANVELAFAQQFNKEIQTTISQILPGQLRSKTLKMKMIPANTLERLKSNIAIANERLNHASSGSTDRPKAIQLRHAKEKARLAQLQLEKAIGDSKGRSPTSRKLAIKRLELMHEIAKLRIEMPDQPEYLIERVDILQWQFDALADEFILLEQRLAAIEDRLDQN